MNDVLTITRPGVARSPIVPGRDRASLRAEQWPHPRGAVDPRGAGLAQPQAHLAERAYAAELMHAERAAIPSGESEFPCGTEVRMNLDHVGGQPFGSFRSGKLALPHGVQPAQVAALIRRTLRRVHDGRDSRRSPAVH